MNGQLNVLQQIDHCITKHNLLISGGTTIHYSAYHRDTGIPGDNVPAALGWAPYHPSTPSAQENQWRNYFWCVTQG